MAQLNWETRPASYYLVSSATKNRQPERKSKKSRNKQNRKISKREKEYRAIRIIRIICFRIKYISLLSELYSREANIGIFANTVSIKNPRCVMCGRKILPKEYCRKGICDYCRYKERVMFKKVSGDGIETERHTNEYRKWRKAVFARDNYTCQDCGQRGGELEAHHIKPWSKHPDLRYEVENGITYCVDCHIKNDKVRARFAKMKGELKFENQENQNI